MKEQVPPKYMQLKEEIISWIATVQFKPHDKLPSENEIAARFAMSRQTVRQALGELEADGWLYRAQGKGTFVAEALENGRRTPQGLTIGLMTTHISNYIFPTIIRGVESALRSQGARLLLASTDNAKAKERESLESMLLQQLNGLIIEPTKSAEGNPNLDLFLALEARKIPYVMLNERYSDLDAPCLKVDDELGGFRAAEHLAKLGHKRIAGFFKTDDFQGVYRMRGFLKSLRERQLPLVPEYLVRYSTEEKETKPAEVLAALLNREPHERPTAIVCYNDELAVRLLDVIRPCGLRVPNDLSIIGFDNSSLATATEVKLTTLEHPKIKMGEDAVALLNHLLEHKDMHEPMSDIIYEPKLILRESSGAAPHEGAN
ncbi:arabinose metabolism transcriptional repressor [Paenibacillus baekrokdamisoli]|uniref:Arabinose metabolism transcriptional repressor n=1 Tax=Paenibacillus baekrokdamisoli TaxID=1712516 RepID=A0A3G9IV56_9BACL|nr:GntR family transcriptional regulator [Paenibacillus baekrokdamisoli]MBB3068250.1 GntR family transcriptional regulator of arabinose operon [Paenibacillus baekrokdamisoli]BBH22707.1 arabinose metabolism transcriptional repressor [Paenibacillus baekrokdamisoli]